MTIDVLNWFAAEMEKEGHQTFRCRECLAVKWLELNEGSTLDDVVTGKGGVSMMRYGIVPETECRTCASQQREHKSRSRPEVVGEDE
tara:strand:- start:53 stop:313 length:261 start_codon:yes stop_codon:yes gene_type:complete